MDVLPFAQPPALPESRVAEIAARHGLRPDDPIVAGNVQSALDLHGRERAGYDGDPARFWDVDPGTGLIDAGLLLDGWIREEVREREAEASDPWRHARGVH